LIRYGVIGHVLGLFLLGLAAAMIPPAALARWDGEGEFRYLAAGFTLTAASGFTTTAFVAEVYERWKPLPQVLLLALMYVGGCTGSSAGGIEISQMVLC